MTEIVKHSRKRSLWLPMSITVIGLVILFGGIFGWYAVKQHFAKQYLANFKPPPVTVSATKAKQETWHPFFSAIGSLVAINGVSVTPEIAGQVDKIYFQSGQMVKQGDPLVKLNTALDEQDLKNYKAQLAYSRFYYNRQKTLFKSKNVSEDMLDKAKSQLQQNEALVAKTKVTIEKKTIRAPFTGKIGIRQVNLGQYIEPGNTIVTLQSLDPLYVNFSLPEQNLSKLSINQPIELTVDAYPHQVFKGKITAINSEVTHDTRNVLVQATIPNDNNKLLPGMFADIKVLLPQQQRVVTVPQTAISYSLYGNSVFVLTPKKSNKKSDKTLYNVKRVYVKTGMERNNKTAILSGLKAGALVATSGQLKLKNDTEATINNSVDISKTQLSNDQLY